MMVTFVSQCQKKALARTRRVLDAFANRIGDNTWQTVITEEGLIAVKTLLRKTATKNTAVACHWIRSRSRSELVWIVGNRDQFGAQGIVPVNFTSKELFMDISRDKPIPGCLYANTHLQKSVGLIDDKVTDPISLFQNKKEAANKRGKISKNSLRGDNRFVQLAVCTVSGLDQYQFEDRYAYQMPISDNQPIDNITAERELIEGYGNSERSLLAHMAKKHHQIKGGKAPFKDYLLMNEARDPENPIYLSYTPEDLDSAGRDSGRHPWAIYYAECEKQPIGAISIKQLTSTED